MSYCHLDNAVTLLLQPHVFLKKKKKMWSPITSAKGHILKSQTAESFYTINMVTHAKVSVIISASPIPPPQGNCRAFADLVSPGGGI